MLRINRKGSTYDFQGVDMLAENVLMDIHKAEEVIPKAEKHRDQ